ncbi:MAG: oligosaccharide flippase family protein [Clostridiales bacterium]|nr:oligosaccharide flippase family protein [Clostridiales bacterium]
MAAGLISFPIMTRIFSVADYGLLGLVMTTITFIIAITKMGLPSAIVRFYEEQKARDRIIDYYSTLFFASLIIAAGITLLFVSILQLLPADLLDEYFTRLLSLAAILIFTRCISATLTSFLRAEQRTKLFNLITIVDRYGSLACSIFLVFFIVKGLYGFFIGQIIASVSILFLLLFITRGRIKSGRQHFCPDELKQAVKFGFPLLWAEMGHLILSYADRYLIQLYLGSTALGLYTAGYNLTTYIIEAMIYPINYAMTPIYMNILVNQGEQQTREFFTKLFTYFMLVLAPAVFGFIAVGKDLISFLASAKYADVYIILPYVILGQAVYACTIILNAGLFINKKTVKITYVMLGACILNVGLNVVLIPLHGILGAAQATLISYFFYALVLTYFSMREFSFSIEYQRIFFYFLASGIMFLIIRKLNFSTSLVNCLVKVIIGALIYSLFILIFDREIRCKSIFLWKNLKMRVMRC